MDEELSDDEHSQAARGSGNGSAPTGAPSTAGDARPVSPPGGYTGPIYSLRFKLVVAVVLIAAVAAMSWVYLRTVDDDGTTPAARGQVASGVESFRPGRGAQVQDQSSVEVELTPGWDGTLTIDGQTIPESDLTRDRQASPTSEPAGEDRPAAVVEDRLEFVPGPGKVLEQLPTGETCVTANVHHRANPEQRRTFDWCFTVF